MSALFETTARFAKRRETGSRFVLETTPAEFAAYNCFYENPQYDLKIGLSAVFVSETIPLENIHGHVVQQRVVTAVILEKGRLKADMEHQLGSGIPRSTVETLLKDFYELVAEFFMTAFGDTYDLQAAGIELHVYEADTRKFHNELRTARRGAGPVPELLAKVQAERVF